MYLVQCNLHLASFVEAGRKGAFLLKDLELLLVIILFWWYRMLQLCQCLLFFHDFATSSRFPSFSPMSCVRTLFIPLLLSGMTNTTFGFFFLHKFGYFTLLISTWYLTGREIQYLCMPMYYSPSFVRKVHIFFIIQITLIILIFTNIIWGAPNWHFGFLEFVLKLWLIFCMWPNIIAYVHFWK